MMRVFSCASFVTLVFAGAMVLPAATVAPGRSCRAGAPTPESYRWNFHQEAQQLIDDVGHEAWQTSYHADQLENFSVEIDWQEHAGELNAIRDQVNKMGSELCRLETIRRVTSPWEQRAIDDAAPLIAEIAGEAQSAINMLNNDHRDLMNPRYRAYAGELYQQSSELSKTLHHFETFNKVHQQDIHLEKSLGLMKKS